MANGQIQSFKENKNAIKNLPKNKQEIADSLINKIVFMESELQKLQKTLKEKGWVEAYQNGANQSGLKKSSEADVYNTLMKNYNSTMKMLNDIVPDVSVQADPIEAEFFK